VFSLLPPPLLQRGVQCVGRLDQDTTGLLLFSDDGQFIHRMIRRRKAWPRCTVPPVREPVGDAMLEALRVGVQLNDEPAPIAALACERLDETTLRLTAGRGQVPSGQAHDRRQPATGWTACIVNAMGCYALPATLAPGAWRWLEPADLHQLEQPWPSAMS